MISKRWITANIKVDKPDVKSCWGCPWPAAANKARPLLSPSLPWELARTRGGSKPTRVAAGAKVIKRRKINVR